MARTKSNTQTREIWWTYRIPRIGRTRLPVPAGLYHKADLGNPGCQTAICVVVRDRFIEAGVDPGFTKYHRLQISERAYGPGHPDDNVTILEDGTRHRHVQPDDDPCGCPG